MHEQGIVHCDIKPANIFVTSEFTGRLGDLDVSRDANERSTIATNKTVASVAGGTFDYMAPELVSKPADFRSDMYSFGLTVFDMFFMPAVDSSTGKLTFRRPTLHDQLAKRVAVDVPLYANEAISARLMEFLDALLQLDPSKRPSAVAALGRQLFHKRLVGIGNNSKERIEF